MDQLQQINSSLKLNPKFFQCPKGEWASVENGLRQSLEDDVNFEEEILPPEQREEYYRTKQKGV